MFLKHLVAHLRVFHTFWCRPNTFTRRKTCYPPCTVLCQPRWPKVHVGRLKSCLCESTLRLRSTKSGAIKGFSIALVSEKNVLFWPWPTGTEEHALIKKIKLLTWWNTLVFKSLGRLKLTSVFILHSNVNSLISLLELLFWAAFCHSAVESSAVDWPFSLNIESRMHYFIAIHSMAILIW